MFQDIRIPQPKKKSLKEVLPRKSLQGVHPVYSEAHLPPPALRGGGRGFRLWLFGALLLALFLIGWLITGQLAAVTVTVTPRSATVSLSKTLTAEKSAVSGLAFETVTTPWQTVKETVPASGAEKVERFASGQIIVYNNFSRESQRLVARTRFEAPDGKIFRIKESIVVPGQSEENGKTAPGAAEAAVYAEEAGADYNLGLIDFTIPGFKGDPRYEKFYARSKTPLAGGFVGEAPVVSGAAVAAAREKLRQSLVTELGRSIMNQLPGEFVTYPEAIFTDFQETDQAAPTVAGDGIAEIAETGRAEAFIFAGAALSQALLEGREPEFDGAAAAIVNLTELVFTLVRTQTSQPATADSINFTVKGDAQVKAVVPAAELVSGLRGVKRREVTETLREFPGIQNATVRFRPPWLWRVPREAERIHLEELPFND